MSGIERVTQPTLDVLEVLLCAYDQKVSIHGWAIMKEAKRSGPTIYKVLDRLEDAGMITGEWEDLAPDQPGPRRRFYMLTGYSVPVVRALLAERRPNALKSKPALGTLFLGWLYTPFGSTR